MHTLKSLSSMQIRATQYTTSHILSIWGPERGGGWGWGVVGWGVRGSGDDIVQKKMFYLEDNPFYTSH